MPEIENYDVLVIGSGEAGKYLAWTTAGEGQRTAVVEIRGDRVFLNLGTHATMPDLPGLAAARPMTHVELLDLDRLPGHLIVVGGGYVGLELAQAMRRFGARVTVIEQGPQLAQGEDADIAAAVLELFRDEGIDVLFRTGCAA